MVEYATTSAYFSGMTYYEETNSMDSIATKIAKSTLYTEHFSDFDWRKEGAVLGLYFGADLHRERTGNIDFVGKRTNNSTFTICTLYETV